VTQVRRLLAVWLLALVALQAFFALTKIKVVYCFM
jgi:hypothetical protein